MKAHISKELADWLKIPGNVDKFGKALAKSNSEDRLIIIDEKECTVELVNAAGDIR